MDSEIFTSIVSLHTKVDDLTATVLTMDCKVNNNRIYILEKVVYGAVKLILVAFIVGVIAVVASSGNKKAAAEQNRSYIIKAK